MKTTILTFLAVCLVTTQAMAGAIGFSKNYTGQHPLVDRQISISIVDQWANIRKVEVKGIILGLDLTMTQNSRTTIETIFDIKNSNNEIVAQIVTTGDCQIVENAYLKFPSGMMILIQPVSDTE